ncbi:MAG: hypothetical protein IKZ82_13890 [Clostridia bacterium]|nr:hypothetical protein [Clostridia bacterium]
MIQKRKEIIIKSTPLILEKLNEILTGQHLDEITPILARIDRTGELPHWFNALSTEGRLPNLDGKQLEALSKSCLYAFWKSSCLILAFS